MAAYKATSVIGFDLKPAKVPFAAPNLTYIQGDILNDQLPEGPFDTIINCSTTEHIGLSGRYGNREEADGDLTAMGLLREKLARPDGRMLFTIPVGIDGVYRPYHRIYGAERLPRILSGYEVVEEAYYAKTDGVNVWRPVSRERALAVQGSDRFYALGLFVLQAVHG
ncbi:MAG TPA: class I SAM-dependent methyltransferase [bacterium]|nr:class I SAM-dependent methyltransferase [bacterium]